ncbi:ROK family transcriptional regulator [Microvirga pudoricolor]|uniref:ROK family transcriptional regulator n=1 Tax=Microvirga pudoricolor TaxID=2778729 RepID=UPI00194F8259|nr:ROK family transcriptional regulator [Microvirga pudoricolor]MBM6595127.1 ROK family transcriptional regulator [Microvirga pudoricolor]
MRAGGLSNGGNRANFTASAKSVFRTLYASGPATRPQIGAALGLSRPTLSSSMAELDRVGYVEKIGEVQGAVGRKASMYRLGTGAGHIIAVDAGSTHVRLRVSTIDRRLLHSRIYRLPSNQRHLSSEISQAVAEEVDAVRAITEPGWGPLRAVGIALPSRVVDKDGDTVSTRQDYIFAHFTPRPGIPLILENNVNCAAFAEHSHGVAKGRADFVYIQIGLKIGMGIVLRNQLVRGRNGGAGEVSHLSFPWGPGLRPENAALETYVGSEAFLERVRQAWPPEAGAPPIDPAQLLALAEAGHPVAVEHVRHHAEDIGAIVSSAVSIVDPGFVVLGGGIGNNPLILPYVRDVVDRLSYPTQIETSVLGPDATVLGIELLTAEHACALLIEDLEV